MIHRTRRCPACASRVVPAAWEYGHSFVCTGCARRWERQDGLGLTRRLAYAALRPEPAAFRPGWPPLSNVV
jgi:hypothetical protein